MAEGGFQSEKQNAVQRTNHAVLPHPPQPLPATQESLNRQPVTQVGTPQTAVRQAPMSTGFSSQEY